MTRPAIAAGLMSRRDPCAPAIDKESHDCAWSPASPLRSLLEIAILDVNVLRYGIVALTVAVTLGLAVRQLLKRQRVSDIVDWWLYTWTGGGIATIALEVIE